jgi:hypothetical protein
MAIARGASQPAAGQHTVAEWEAWLEKLPLVQDEVVKAEEAWRESFGAHAQRYVRQGPSSEGRKHTSQQKTSQGSPQGRVQLVPCR